MKDDPIIRAVIRIIALIIMKVSFDMSIWTVGMWLQGISPKEPPYIIAISIFIIGTIVFQVGDKDVYLKVVKK